MASIMPMTSARVMSVMGRSPPADKLATEQLPGGTAGSLPGQVPGSEFLNHAGDGDRLAPVLGGPQGAGALTGVNAAGKIGQCDTGRLAGFRQAQCRILAQHHANGCGFARQPPHDVKRDNPAVGDPNAEIRSSRHPTNGCACRPAQA